ncbi:MAG: MalY/PatB family protein [Fusicatenibacter sp.]
MSTNFDQIINRKGTNCAKWDGQGGDYLPMWVADMDFLTAQPILDAVQKRFSHGVFGYGGRIKEAIASIVNHYKQTYDVDVDPDWVVYIPSVMPGANLACRVGGGGLIYSTPMYSHIRRLSQEAHTHVTEVPMKENNLFYEMDFDALEETVTDDIGVLVLCNPHNPVGRVYTRGELEQAASFAETHQLLVVCDEIHCELVLEGKHIPYFSLNKEAEQNSITLSSAGKIANIPSLPAGFAIIPNPELRRKFKDQALGLFSTPNVLAIEALDAAYNGSCNEWKEELRSYLRGNRDYLEERIKKIEGLSIVHNQGTYLAWIDCRKTGLKDPFAFFKENAKVRFNDGRDYGSVGEGFVRINFGCPRSQLVRALDCVERALEKRS